MQLTRNYPCFVAKELVKSTENTYAYVEKRIQSHDTNNENIQFDTYKQ